MLLKSLLLSMLTISITADDRYFTFKDEPKQSRYSKVMKAKSLDEQKWFTQRLTHDGSEDSYKIWSQRYYVNDKYYKPGGPAFLYVGGEWELSSYRAQDSIILDAAKKHNGIVYALEHRFYGKSYPKNDLSLNSLKFLSSELALGDLAYFAENVKLPGNLSSKNNTVDTKWILQGGSYPGNLVAWSRLTYPKIFHGAIAISAPIEAKIDFYESDQMVQKFILKHGGKKCLTFHNEVFEAIDDILIKGSEKDKENFKSKFGCKGVSDENVAFNLMFATHAVQDNNSTQVIEHCNSLDLDGSIKDKINSLSKRYLSLFPSNSCKEKLHPDSRTSKKPASDSVDRQWSYQSCTEFGYFQIAPPKGLPTGRSRVFGLDSTIRVECGEIFGLKTPLYPNTNKINSKYGGKKFYADNVMFVNGDMDPWSALSITNSTHKLMPAIIVKGESHVPASGSVSKVDSEEVAEAKKKILKFIDNILQ